MGSPEELLTEGLTTGYAGKNSAQTWSGCFETTTSQLVTTDGVYRDVWKADRAGGGQEMATTGNRMVTRLYGGGTVSHDKLNELGLTKKDVTKYLKSKILELKGSTRLYEECNPEPDGDWQYAYQIILKLEDIPLTQAIELINYRGVRVFAHAFIISPIE